MSLEIQLDLGFTFIECIDHAFAIEGVIIHGFEKWVLSKSSKRVWQAIPFLSKPQDLFIEWLLMTDRAHVAFIMEGAYWVS